MCFPPLMDLDFTLPLSSSPNFTDLLSSQQEINSPQPFSQTQSPLNQPQLATKRSTPIRWSVLEEKVLVGAWLNTSKNVLVGNEQKGGAFWQRVTALYAASPVVAKLPKREPNTCKKKWQKLNESVSKFAGCFEYAKRNKKSGQNEDDIMEMAYQLYFQNHQMKFTLEHVWRLLRNDQKWCELFEKTNQSSKRAKLSDGMNFSSSSKTGCPVEEEPEQRPSGVKAAKAKERKRGKGKSEETDGGSLKVIEEAWVMKKEDLSVKQRLSREKILDSLLLKTQPLTEGELILKDKLVTQMCNEIDGSG